MARLGESGEKQHGQVFSDRLLAEGKGWAYVGSMQF